MSNEEKIAFRVNTRVGNLIEARVFGLRSREEVDAYADAFARQFAQAPVGSTRVLCADHRPVLIYPQAVARRLAELFTLVNPRLPSVAILAARTNATLTLQLERLVREAANPGRKLCFSVEDAEAHLAPSLTVPEMARLRSFLREFPPKPTDTEPTSGSRSRV